MLLLRRPFFLLPCSYNSRLLKRNYDKNLGIAINNLVSNLESIAHPPNVDK